MLARGPSCSPKIPSTTHCQSCDNSPPSDSGFFRLTYPSSSYAALKASLENHGAEAYSFQTNVIDASITAFALNGRPVTELFLNESYEEVHATAVNRIGEALIMGLAYHHRNFTSIAHGQIVHPLPYKKGITPL